MRSYAEQDKPKSDGLQLRKEQAAKERAELELEGKQRRIEHVRLVVTCVG